MKVGSFLLALIVMAIASAVLLGMIKGFGSVIAGDVYLTSPSKVTGYKPSLMFIEVPVNSNVKLRIHVHVSAKLNESVPGISLPTPLDEYFSLSYITIGVHNRSKLIAFAIPSLPYYERVMSAGGLISKPIKLTVSSTATIELYINGSLALSKAINVVRPVKSENLPPFVATEIYPPSIQLYEETYGLSPLGHALPQGKTLQLLVLTVDDNSNASCSLHYNLDNASWRLTACSVFEKFQRPISNLEGNISKFISSVESSLAIISNISIPKPKAGIVFYKAVVPGQEPGHYIMYYVTARDAYGEETSSLEGLYYTSNSTGMPILIVDPHVDVFIAYMNAERAVKEAKLIASYLNMSVESVERSVKLPLKIVNESVMKPLFHYWEAIGKDYNIYIVRPYSGVSGLLDNFKPKAIILSNLFLGIRNNALLDWDLSTIKTNNGGTLLEDIINYVKEHHAGLIATHGTLSDTVVASCKGGKLKIYVIGSLGHVGSNISDINPFNESTVSGMLGLNILPLWEYAKFTIARLICACSQSACSPPAAVLASVIGSIPLQDYYIPFKGELKVTKEGRMIGWDIPSEFNITIPGPWERYGFKAITEVGWQLALPHSIMYGVANVIKKLKPLISSLHNRLRLRISNITGIAGIDRKLYLAEGNMTAWGLKRLYELIINSTYINGRFNASIRIPDYGVMKVNITLPKNVIDKLISLIPVKVVAISPNGLAGIITYDKFWDSNGYRSVYFSFEVEASPNPVASKLLINAIRWSTKWEYRSLLSVLGSPMKAPSRMIHALNTTLRRIKGRVIVEKPVILTEAGGALLPLRVPGTSGNLTLVAFHPYLPKVKVMVRGGKILRVQENYSSKILIALIKPFRNTVMIRITPDAESPVSPVYVTVKYQPTGVATTTTTTVATTTSAKATSTPASTTTSPATQTSTTHRTATVTVTATSTVPVTSVITSTVTLTKTITTTSPKTVTTSKTLTLTAMITKTMTTALTLSKTKTVTTAKHITTYRTVYITTTKYKVKTFSTVKTVTSFSTITSTTTSVKASTITKTHIVKVQQLNIPAIIGIVLGCIGIGVGVGLIVASRRRG